jgi:hypothetical protein
MEKYGLFIQFQRTGRNNMLKLKFLLIFLIITISTRAQEGEFWLTPNGTDPTEPRTRIDFIIAQATVLSNGELFGTQISGELAFTKWFSAGLAVPFIYASLSSDPDGSGIGDVALRALVAPYQAKTDAVFRAVGLGAEVSFKTGDVDQGTGRGQNVFSPYLAASFEVAKQLLFIPLVRESISFDSEDPDNDINDLSVHVPFIYTFSGGFWISLDLEGVYDLTGEFQPLYLFNSEIGIMVNEKIGFAGVLTNNIAGQKQFDVFGSLNMRILF